MMLEIKGLKNSITATSSWTALNHRVNDTHNEHARAKDNLISFFVVHYHVKWSFHKF